MSQLTKADIAAIRQADSIVIRLEHGTGSVSLIKNAQRTAKTPFAQDVVYVLDVPVTAHTGPVGVHVGFESFYQHACAPGQSILRMLKAGDQIRFHFFPDANTSPKLAQAGLHFDLLELDVHRKIGKRTERFTFNFQTSIGPDDEVRMSRSYKRPEYSRS